MRAETAAEPLAGDLGKPRNAFIAPARTAARWISRRLLPARAGQRLYDTLRGGYGYLFRRGILIASVVYDTRRFIRWSFALRKPRTRAQQRAFLTMKYHTFEKGLALPQPRPGFGQDRLAELLSVLVPYERRFGCDEVVAVCVKALAAYQAFNADHGVRSADLDALLDGYLAKHPQLAQPGEGGTKPVTRDGITRAAAVDFESFVLHRHSIRDFASKPVDRAQIAAAVRLAQRSPSVCNRQAGRVHVYDDASRIGELLRYQSGNRGFGHIVPALCVITADLQVFASPGERFQGWIDGGLFAMTLIYALHAQGLGSCCLNWSVTLDIDKPMRRAAGIADNELVIMMLAVGHLPETLRVACSPRKPLDEVLVYHEARP
ncbi:MAG: nitroreductase family protein [Rhodospirillales bacterium]|jgi:nitroreductase|nr:nitroreductase family protein [Rhodospirillales bacterium]